MKITTRHVLQHFLEMMLGQLQQQKTDELDPYFEDFFTKEEVIEMVKSKYGSNVDGHLKVVRLNKPQLLEYLCNADILHYFLAAWKNEIEQNKAITPLEVFKTLDQLGLLKHYLASKAIAFWDEEDFSHYRVLSGKAGKVYTIYGIYDADVDYEDIEKVSTHPKRFYETHKKAQDELDILITQGNYMEEELHVLPLLVGDA